MTVTLREVGDRAFLIEVQSTSEALSVHVVLSAAAVPGIVDIVPAAQTVLVTFDGLPDIARVRKIAEIAVAKPPRPAAEDAPVLVPTVYDGADLTEVARITGLDEAEVVARHSLSTYTVAFSGFAPGFAYLTGGDPLLEVPRRASPRTGIPRGAVALAGRFSGIYPRVTPGGWQLIGRTSFQPWDLSHPDGPARLRPGVSVRFVPERESLTTSAATPEGAAESGAAPQTPEAGAGVEVRRVSGLATIQDRGRPGQGSIGVPGSGAMDQGALDRANRAVGNERGAATIELAGGVLVLRSAGRNVVAVAGGGEVIVTRAHSAVSFRAVSSSPVALDDADTLEVTPAGGVYSYVAIRGGFGVSPTLGSRSTDVLSGLGPSPLTMSAFLPRGTGQRGSVAPVLEPVIDDALPVLRYVPGPRADWFDPDAFAALDGQEWVVGAQSNRIGIRLSGSRPLRRRLDAELPSEGVVAGAIQVPSDGQPVLFGADHPATGGYPVIGVVLRPDLDRAAQVPPGGRLRFQAITGPLATSRAAE